MSSKWYAVDLFIDQSKIGRQSVPFPFGYRCQIVSGVHNRIGSLKMYRESFEKIFMKKKLKKSKVKQIQKEIEMKKFIFLGKIILLTNQKSVDEVYHSHLVTGTQSYRESTIVSGVSKCIGSVLRKNSRKKK
jgi:hypothetical protein